MQGGQWIAPALALVLWACGSAVEPPTTLSCAGLSAPPENLPRAQRVVIVSVDGLRPDLITPDDTPHVHRLAREGAATLEAQTVRPSLTLPAHTSMVCGLVPERHQVLWNKHRPDRGYVEVRTIFDAAREAELGTALFSGKEKLWHLADPRALDHAVARRVKDAELMGLAVAYLEEHRPHLMMIHLADADYGGHRHGWGTAGHRLAIQEADRTVGLLVDALERLDLAKSSVVILTADHGGEGRVHKHGRPSDMAVPWIAWGGGIAARKLPPVCVTATAPVALRILGLPVPDGWGDNPEPPIHGGRPEEADPTAGEQSGSRD